MNDSAASVEIGATPTSVSERMLFGVQASLIVSRRKRITAANWRIAVESPFWRLYYHDRNGVHFRSGNDALGMRANQLYLIPAWLRFSAHTIRDVVQDYLHFNLTGISITLTRSVFQGPVHLTAETPGLTALVRQWRDNVSETGNKHLSDQLKVSALMNYALALAIDGLPESNRSRLQGWLEASHPITNALQMIDDNLANPPSNARLAAVVGQSTDHFARRFKQAIGMTPARYGIERRIAVATQRLILTDDRIDEIAVQTGFADRFHFSRAFRSVVGVPPGQFRFAHH